MKEHPRYFKECISQACTVMRVHFSEFAQERGLADFSIDVFREERTPAEIAWLALSQLCMNDRASHDAVVVLAVIEFLDHFVGQPKEDSTKMRRTKDLAELMAGSSSQTAFREWVETWYPA